MVRMAHPALANDTEFNVRYFRLPLLLLLLSGPGLAQADLLAGIEAYELRDKTRAEKLLRPLAEAGSPVAQFYMAEIYRFGKPLYAAEWYRKAAEQGHAQAQLRVGDYYSDGEAGLPKDKVQSAYWYRKAADQGNQKAENLIGEAYDQGRGVPQDHRQANSWFRKAALQGDANAFCNLSGSYEKGEGVEQDMVLAYAYMKIAVSRFAALACELKEEALREKLSASVQQAGTAMAQSWQPGKPLPGEKAQAVSVIPQSTAALKADERKLKAGLAAYAAADYGKAASLLLEAAEAGQPEAQFLLGQIYKSGLGLPKLPQDYYRALHWYGKAADQSHTEAQVKLGLLYAMEFNVFHFYDDVVNRLYLQAADKGNAEAQFWIGERYDWEGVRSSPAEQYPKPDPEKALQYYRLAAEQGYAPAFCRLGWMTRNDDRVRSYAYYGQAADAGVENCLHEWKSAGKGMSDTQRAEAEALRNARKPKPVASAPSAAPLPLSARLNEWVRRARQEGAYQDSALFNELYENRRTFCKQSDSLPAKTATENTLVCTAEVTAVLSVGDGSLGPGEKYRYFQIVTAVVFSAIAQDSTRIRAYMMSLPAKGALYADALAWQDSTVNTLTALSKLKQARSADAALVQSLVADAQEYEAGVLSVLEKSRQAKARQAFAALYR